MGTRNGKKRMEPKQIKHNLHGFSRKEAKEYVTRALYYANVFGLRKIQFITGWGKHSHDQVPILRPYVIELCQKLGCRAEKNAKNDGVVDVFIKEKIN